MRTFLKANMAAVIASAADYTITIVAVHFFSIHAVSATVTGTISGGILNFLLGRFWAFNETQTSSYQQAYKYLLVWIGNLLLTACGMYLLTKYAVMHYAIAKLVTAVIIALTYNYPLQRNYVFRKT